MAIYKTPEFVAGFCAISKPYENEFIIKGRFEGETKEAFLASLKQAVDADPRPSNTIKPSGVKAEVDAEGEQTGAILVTFKCKAGGVRKKDGQPWSRSIKVVDSKNKPVGEEVSKGSTVRLAFTTYGTSFQGTEYLRLQPYMLQVKDLVTYEGGSDGGNVFDEIEGGFESKAAPAPAKAEPVASDASDAWDF